MRVAILVVGIVLAVIGAVLLFVPLSPQPNQAVSKGSTTPFAIFSVPGLSLTGSIPVAVSWTSGGGAAVTVIAAACSASCQTTTSIAGLSSLTYQNGTSGSFTLSQPDGGEVFIAVFTTGGGAATSNVSFKVTAALTTVGSALLIVGIVVLIVGVVLKSGKAKMAAAAMAPMSPSTPTSPMPPPSPPMGPS